MTSRFLGLFRRGGYVAPVVAKESDETGDNSREERERFTVAAISFCLEHDRVFRSHFLQRFLQVTKKGDSQACSVQLEPCQQQDLLIEFDEQVAVVEFKLGAPLGDHQRWDRRAFWRSGYGKHLLTNYDRKKRRYYFIVGCNLPSDSKRGIKCRSLKWDDILPQGRRETRLERDLFDCIAEFGVPTFFTRRMKITSLSAAAKTAVNAVAHMRTVCSKAGLRSDGRADISEGHFGIYVKKAPPKNDPNGAHSVLASALAPKGSRSLAWLGYELSEQETLRPALYFYCSSKAGATLAEQLSAHFKGNFKPWRKTEFAIYKDDKDAMPDLEWFLAIISRVTKILKSAKAEQR